MDARISRFREHLRRVASAAVPSYADCLGRAARTVGLPAPPAATLRRGTWRAPLAVH